MTVSGLQLCPASDQRAGVPDLGGPLAAGAWGNGARDFPNGWGTGVWGDNPAQVHALTERFLAPLGARLERYPKGRKGYNGLVERSHRTDDEECYRPYALRLQSPEDVLRYAQRWVAFYNVHRPHFGAGMERRLPYSKRLAKAAGL